MADVKKVSVELLLEEKSFTNKESGEVINYTDVTAIIDGVNIGFSVKKDCKKLFNYVIAKKFDK